MQSTDARALPVRKIFLGDASSDRTASLVDREWLVANGLGGYASGSFAGVPTRRFHGYLIAALAAPIGRATMLNRLSESIRLPNGEQVAFTAEDGEGGTLAAGVDRYIREARLEGGLPVWTYVIGDYVVEKRVLVVHLQNTVHVTYTLLEGDERVRLRVRPYICFRPHEGRVDVPPGSLTVHATADRYEVTGSSELPALRVRVLGGEASLVLKPEESREKYPVEEARGYDYMGTLSSPGYFRMELSRGARATLVASTESWSAIDALTPAAALDAERLRRQRLVEMADPHARTGVNAELVLAADQFIVTPSTRADDATRARAAGDEVRTVIAGYHWFTDWGRDTMISLEGLTLVTGRYAEAGYILRTFAHYVRDGLIPNLFPEGTNEGLYHTADATLWYFHALSRYLEATSDRATLEHLLPVLRSIADAHLAGTRFGIKVDAKDGLLHQGQEGYQLTWMDAKVGNWVVTPRRGKAVEINALFYNALMLLAGWLREYEDAAAAAPYAQAAERARASFNARFWYEKGKHLYDVVDGENGDDAACRPNQLVAFSLEHPVLDSSRWEDVLKVCESALMTPVGLRSLSPGNADYKARYFGDRRARDAAYHQGTVWAWLIGPFFDAWSRTRPDSMDALRRSLSGLESHLGEACIGQVSEVFDAEAPYTPRGCIAQAWSVAELLRCRVRLAASHDARQET
ncbi:MAG TPA: amylo-alpha-1,6-glucosidase [Polyangiaceae bacterium]|jgi:predicted glycogen debranching enzyme|nr:amylo-alpha-1,6-glucosidase [Polyangiaceae bacterium]